MGWMWSGEAELDTRDCNLLDMPGGRLVGSIASGGHGSTRRFGSANLNQNSDSLYCGYPRSADLYDFEFLSSVKVTSISSNLNLNVTMMGEEVGGNLPKQPPLV